MPSTSRRWIVGVGCPLLAVAQTHAEDQVGFTHESYVEDHGRMSVQTESVRVEKSFAPWLDVTLRGIYDGISGATPIGAPAIDQLRLHRRGSTVILPTVAITGFTRTVHGMSGASPVTQAMSHSEIPLAQSDDIRRGIDLAPAFTFGPNRLTPEFSYSKENDYISYAFALNYSREFNDKNTILNVGWSHACDRVLDNSFTYLNRPALKNTDDFIVGFSQLLSRETVFSASGTISHADGYLNDPYRSVVFDETSLDANARAILDGEKRPSTKDSQAVLLTLTQAVTPLNASVEASYRYYHDSFGTIANTAGVAWFQKIGNAGVISPSLRYYRQGAAHFYGIQFPGDPATDPQRVPQYYSSDYRLSFLETFTFGIEADIKLHDQWDLRLGYQRYWMRGLDHETLQSTYPSASIFTIGLNVTF